MLRGMDRYAPSMQQSGQDSEQSQSNRVSTTIKRIKARIILNTVAISQLAELRRTEADTT